MVGLASSRGRSERRRGILGAIVLLALLVTPPTVLALTEAAPSLIWTTTFTSGDETSFALTAGCNDSPGKGLLDVDWLSNDPVLAYGLNPSTSDDNNVVVVRLRASSGATYWTTATQSTGKDIATCALALDQRGRVYVSATAFNGGTPAGEGMVVYNGMNGSRIVDITSIFTGGSFDFGNRCGTISVDLVSNVSDKHPSAAVSCGDSTNAANWIWKPSGVNTTADYTKTCNSASGNWGPIGWRQGNASKALWSISNPNGISRLDASACSVLAKVTNGISTSDMSDTVVGWGLNTMDWVAKHPSTASAYRRTRVDATDTSDPLAVNSTQTINIKPGVWDSGSPVVDPIVHWYELAADNHPLLCGRFDASDGTIRHFFGRFDTNSLSWAWSVNFTRNSDRSIEGCRLGTDGSVYVYGKVAGTPQRAYVRRYCCITSTARFRTDLAQAVVPVNPATGGGNQTNNTAGDIGQGIKDFFLGIGCESTGSLFFCGLVLVIVASVATAAATSSTTKNRIFTFVLAAIVAIAMMVFLVYVGVWPFGALILLIIAAAGVSAAYVRKSFLGGA